MIKAHVIKTHVIKTHVIEMNKTHTKVLLHELIKTLQRKSVITSETK